MKTTIRITLFAAFCLLVSCKTTKTGMVPDLNGMVYDFSNRPVPHCTVSLGKKLTGSTDINGRFTLHRVPVGTRTITGQKQGYESYTGEVQVVGYGQIIYFRIPSQNQLLNLADESLAHNDLPVAEEYIQRAYQIDQHNTVMLFYYATVKYRQKEYAEAIKFLEAAKNLGSRDIYIDKFLNVLRRRLTNDETNNE